MKQVLAVDDSDTMQKMLRQLITMGGYQPIIAVDGEDALEKFKAQDVDLVLTDINMPKMDGLTLIAKIREENSKVPILTVTTESEASMREKGAKAGANGWIVKPIKVAEIVDLMKNILG